ncbi:MAG: hypothetical protein ACR2J8_03545 [Thermomicrobiales bacterium]
MQAIDRIAFQRAETHILQTLAAAAPTRDTEAIAAALRAECDRLTASYTADTGKVIDGFRGEMLKVITATDDQVIRRHVPFALSDDALHPLATGPDESSGTTKSPRTVRGRPCGHLHDQPSPC